MEKTEVIWGSSNGTIRLIASLKLLLSARVSPKLKMGSV
jgi:hypothetical protein